MLSSDGGNPEKRSNFDTLDSSMSAVVQELYADLPVALSAELTALSDPKIVLDVQTEASAFVLPRDSDLPSDHQRNYGMKTCYPNSDEGLDCTGNISCPRQVEVILEEPAVTGELAEDADVQNRSLLKEDSLCRNLRQSAKVADVTKDVPEEGFVQYSLTPQENCCSEWEQSWLNQKEQEFLSRSSCAEVAGFLQNPEANSANMQGTTESLPNAIKEAQGMKADGTRLFRERNARVSTGVPPESSNVDNVMAKVEVSETSTLFSHKPANVMDNASSEEHLKEDNQHQEATSYTVLSATAGACVLSGSEAVGETSFGQQKDANATLNDSLPFQQDKTNLLNNVSIPVSETLVALDDWLSDMSFETSSLHFKSCLEFGSVFWEENVKLSEVICEMQEECPLGNEDSLENNASSEAIELLEEWASDINVKRTSSPAWSSEDPSTDDEQEMGIRTDHSYSSVCKQSSKCQTYYEHLEDDDIRPVLSETDNTKMEVDQLCAFLSDGRTATEIEENGPFLTEISNTCCRQKTSSGLQNSSVVSINSVPTYHDFLGDATKLSQEDLPKTESSGDTKKGILDSASVAQLHTTNSTCTVGTNLGIDEENHERIQFSDDNLFTQQADVALSSAEFLDSLPGEGLPGLCAKSPSRSTNCLFHHRSKLPSANHKCSSCILTSVPSVLNDAGRRMTDVTTTANIEEGDRLEMSCASVLIKTAGPPEDYYVKGCDHPANESSWSHLIGRVGNLDSVCSAVVSSTDLALADSLELSLETENQRTDDDGGVNPEEILNVDISSYPLDRNLEQEPIKAPQEVNDGMEMMETAKVYENRLGSSMNEKSTGGRGLDKTIHPLKFHGFTKGQSQKVSEEYQAPLSSSLEVSSLKTDLISDHPDCIKQQDRPILGEVPDQLQMRAQALACHDYHLNSLDSLNQKHVTPQEMRVLACQQQVMVISKKQLEDTTVWTVNHSLEETKKPVIFSQGESLCPKRVQETTPLTHPVLLIKNYVQETFYSSTRGNSSCYKKASELISSPLKRSLIKLNNAGMLLECLGLASELQKSSRFVRKRAHQRTEFSSVLQSVRRRPLEMRNKKCFQEVRGKPRLRPNHGSFRLNKLMFTTAGSQRTIEGVCSKLFKDSFICISLGMQSPQNLVACLPGKDKPSTSLSLNVFDSSPLVASLERKANDYIHLVFSEDGKSCCSVKGIIYVGCLPGSQERLISTMCSMPGVEVTGESLSIASSGPVPSENITQSSDNNHGERSLITEKTKIPIYLLSKDSSRIYLDLRLVGKEEIIIPFKSEVHLKPPFPCPSECISELGLDEGHTHAKDPFKLPVVKQHALQPKCIFPLVTSGTLCSAVPFPSLSISLFEALANWFSSKGRKLQSTENQARDQRKPLGCLANLASEALVNKPTPEIRNSPALTKRMVQEGMEQSLAKCTVFSVPVSQQWGAKDNGEAENLFRQRSIRIGYLLANFYNKVVALNAGKPEGPTWTLVIGDIVEDSENKRPCSTLRDSESLKRSKELTGLEYTEAKGSEARSPTLCVTNRSQQSASIYILVAPVLCTLSQAFGFCRGRIKITFGSARKISQSLPFRRRSGNICKKDHMQGHFKVRRKSNQIKSSAFLKYLLKIVPKNQCKLISSVRLAMEPAAVESKAAVMWNQTPKQRAYRSSLRDACRISEHTKDQAILKKLSALASNLLAPSTNPQTFKQSMNSTEFPLIGKNSQLRRKKLLEVFSWVNLKLNFQRINGSKYSTKMFNSPSLALYTEDSTNVSDLESSNRIPLAFSTLTFPFPFHIKMCSSPLWSTMDVPSLHSATNRVASGEPEALQPAKWTFSLHLSQSSLSEFLVHGRPCVPAEFYIASASLHAEKDSRRYAVAERSSGHSVFGLQTALALSSPGCYRVWTRKRNLTSQIPAIQRLTVLQFAQGLKGLKCSSSVSADLFSSLPYLLGRVLSIWSQHGPSTCPSEFTPLHSNRCKWQPVTTATTRLGLGNRTFIAESSAMLPHVPDQVVDIPRIVHNELRLEPYFSASLPTSCSIPEPEHSPLGDLLSQFQAHPLGDVSVPVLPTTGTQLKKAKLEKRPKKVSQIRIRKTIPKPDPNLTPMGLPRPKRLKKKEFSLEEIYTNKNYKSPPATRCLETIFEEPKEKNGSLISVSQQKRKRILEFQDFTIPRKRKARSRIKVTGSFTRAQKAALEGRELDALLIQKLTDLEAFFAMEEEREQGHAPGS